MTIKREVWHLCSEGSITGHDQQMQLRLPLDEGHLVLDNGKFDYDVINSRRDYSDVLCLRAKGRLDELSKLFDSIITIAHASKESWPKHQSFNKARLANNNVPVVDDYFDRASRAYEIAKPWGVASGTASNSEADDVFNVSRIDAVLGHVSTSDFIKPTPDARVGMGFNTFGKASGAYELAKSCGAVARGTTSSCKTNGVYSASRTDKVLGHLDTRSLTNLTCKPAGVERRTYLPPYHGVIKEQSVGLAIEKFSGDIMCYLKFKRKFAKYVENVYQNCDVCLSHLESLCVGEAHRAIKGLTLHRDREYAYGTA